MDPMHAVQQTVPSAPRIVYCTACGAPACGTFCSSCGAPLRSDPPAAPPSVPCAETEQEELPSGSSADGFDVYATPAPKRKHTGLIVLSILTGVSVVFMITAMMIHFFLSGLSDIGLTDPLYETEIYRGGVSAEEYDRLQLGMTYAHISSIIGGDGEPIENGTDVYGNAYYIYGWPGEYGDYAAVFITFTNDVATEITLDGYLE